VTAGSALPICTIHDRSLVLKNLIAKDAGTILPMRCFVFRFVGQKAVKQMAWSDKFGYPIRWGAQSISTLQEAQVFILALPNLQQIFPAWLGAFTLLSKAAEHGGLWRDRARIEIVSALLGSSPAGRAANASSLDPGGKSLSVVQRTPGCSYRKTICLAGYS
jgi:hypothetical protein